jgi:PKD domain-containing protein
MITRTYRSVASIAVLAGLSILASSCQKVPLLAPSGSIITLLATTSALPVNGSTEIIAQLIEPSGTPPQRGTLVTFTTTLGSIRPSEAETDASGRAIVMFHAGTGSGTATISAISGGVSVVAANALKIAVGTAAVGGITVSANPTSLSAAGGTSTITASVFDAGGNNLASVPVTFSTDNGTLSASVVTTDASGQAQTLLTTGRTAIVTATAGVSTTGTGTGTGATTTTAPSNKVTVNVNASATVSFGAFTPTPALAGQPVSFTLTVTPAATGGGTIRQVVVNFGDGQSQNLGAVQGATPLSHIYNGSGVFSLTATATDSNGDQFQGAANVTVNPRPGLPVTISSSANPRAGTPTTFAISATPSSGASITSIRVNFGDGQSVTLPGNATSVQHVYATSGEKTVTASATDTTGASGSGSTVIFVQSGTGGTGVVIASFTVTPPTGAAATTTFTFNSSGSSSTAGTIVNFVWQFGDGTPTQSTTNTTITHSYAVAGPGTYQVILTVIDSQGNSESTTRSVTAT